MVRKMMAPLLGVLLAGAVAASPDASQRDLVWMHDSGDWGAWGAYVLPESDFVIFSFGCTGSPGLLNFHLELPVADGSEGESSWLELHRNGEIVRFGGEVFFSEFHSEHQVLANAPSVEETFDVLRRFFGEPGTISIAAPSGTETLPVDSAAAEALEVVRQVCLGR